MDCHQGVETPVKYQVRFMILMHVEYVDFSVLADAEAYLERKKSLHPEVEMHVINGK